MQKLKWKNLLDNKCPKCGDKLQFFPGEEMMMCSIICGFMMRQEKMQSMVVKMAGGKFTTKPSGLFEDNLSALNNMGNDKIQNYEDEETVVYTK